MELKGLHCIQIFPIFVYNKYLDQVYFLTSHLVFVTAIITVHYRMHCKPLQIKSDKLFCDSHPWCDLDVCTLNVKLLRLISQSCHSLKAINPYHFVSHSFFLCLQQR